MAVSAACAQGLQRTIPDLQLNVGTEPFEKSIGQPFEPLKHNIWFSLWPVDNGSMVTFSGQLFSVQAPPVIHYISNFYNKYKFLFI